MDDKTTERITLLRERHVTRASAGTPGRITLLREMHVELAERDAALRERGFKLDVLQTTRNFNFCPYLSRPVSNVYCATNSVNITHPLCFGCPKAAEWAESQQWFTTYDPRDDELYKPYDVDRVVPENDRFVYERITWPNGDVRWFKRYRWHRLEVSPSDNRDHRVSVSRESSMHTMAPFASAVPAEFIAKRREEAEAERRRTGLSMVPKVKKTKAAAKKPTTEGG